MLGWLRAIPKGAQESRIRGRNTYPLPPVGAASYLTDWFIELKFEFDHQEILAWAQLKQIDIEPWEVEVLMSASTTYIDAKFQYTDPIYNLSPPYDGRTLAQKREDVTDGFERMIERSENADRHN